jgi:hypothetical protein
MQYAMAAESTIDEIARLNRIDSFYECGLLGAVAKGHRARRGRVNPYKMKAHCLAWQFGFDRWQDTWEQVQADWLHHRTQEGQRLTRLLQRSTPQYEPAQPMHTQGHGAKIIAFPTDRIIRRVEHGAPVVAQPDTVRLAPQDAA